MTNRAKVARAILGAGVAAIALTVGLYAAVTFGTGTAPGWATTERACLQPDTLSYVEGSAYGVYVKEPWALALTSGPSHAVVSRDASGGYGVWVELNRSGDPRRVTCTWTADAVEIRETNGIVHTVPARVFTGGR